MCRRQHEEMVQTIKWKLARGKFRPNLVNLVQMNTPRVIVQDTKKAFRKLAKTEGDVQAAAAILCNLKGVGPAMASAVLAAGAPELAPFMADECLLAMPDVDSLDYTMKEYMNYVEHIKACVERLNQQGGAWNPHKVELAVWTYYIAMDLKPELLSDLPSAAECAAAQAAAAAAVAAPATAAAEEESNDASSEPSAAAATAAAEEAAPKPEEASDVQPDSAAEDSQPPATLATSKQQQQPSNGTSCNAEDATDEDNAKAAADPESPERPAEAAINGQEDKKNGHSNNGSSSEDSSRTAAAPEEEQPKVNGTNGNGVASKEEQLSAAAAPVTNGSSEKRENGTTKLSEAVSPVKNISENSAST